MIGKQVLVLEKDHRYHWKDLRVSGTWTFSRNRVVLSQSKGLFALQRLFSGERDTTKHGKPIELELRQANVLVVYLPGFRRTIRFVKQSR